MPFYIHEALVGLLETEFISEAQAKRQASLEKQADPTAGWFTVVEIAKRPTAKERASFELPTEEFVSVRNR
jgi:hypothetical protein